MKIIKTFIKDLLVIEGKIHKDSRGYFREVLLEKFLKKLRKTRYLKKNLFLIVFLTQKKIPLEVCIYRLKKVRLRLLL